MDFSGTYRESQYRTCGSRDVGTIILLDIAKNAEDRASKI